MGVGEARAFLRHAVHVRRRDLLGGVVAAEVALAEVVGEDHDDVRPARTGVHAWEGAGGEQGEGEDAEHRATAYVAVYLSEQARYHPNWSQMRKYCGCRARSRVTTCLTVSPV